MCSRLRRCVENSVSSRVIIYYFLRATKIRTRRDSQSLWLRKHAGSVNMSCLVLRNLSLTLNKLCVLKQNHKKPHFTVFNYQPAPDIARHVYIDQNRSASYFLRANRVVFVHKHNQRINTVFSQRYIKTELKDTKSCSLKKSRNHFITTEGVKTFLTFFWHG